MVDQLQLQDLPRHAEPDRHVGRRGAGLMPTLDPGLLADYNRSRGLKEPGYVCNAPYRNIYFNVLGQAAACWLTFFEAPRYPEHSIHEIWFGPYFERLRGLI